MNTIKNALLFAATGLLFASTSHADEWMDCKPYRVAVRSNGAMHIACENVGGWYSLKASETSKDYMDRVLYVGTSAIMAGKSVKLQVAKPGKDGRIEAIEMFK